MLNQMKHALSSKPLNDLKKVMGYHLSHRDESIYAGEFYKLLKDCNPTSSERIELDTIKELYYWLLEELVDVWTNTKKVNLLGLPAGTKLRTRQGEILTIVKDTKPRDSMFPIKVMYPNGSFGTRRLEGTVGERKRYLADQDIVEVLTV